MFLDEATAEYSRVARPTGLRVHSFSICSGSPVEPRSVAEHCASRGVNVWNGDNYAYELCEMLGLHPAGAVRAGIVHYNDASDVDRLLSAVADLAAYPR
jgi:selenocysteine lyase/cysteine desulfurase